MTEANSANLLKAAPVVRSAFREYYFRHSAKIEIPERISEREFGYSHFGGTGMVRHLSFKSGGELLATLIKEVPLDVYCSNAYYKFPANPMQEKQWSGADLIFDIDGKDLDLPCVPSHSYGICSECRKVSSPADKTIDQCQSCNAKKLNQVSIPCSRCIDASKKEVKKLLALLKDLGIDRKDIRIYFSGNNGFHLLITDSTFVPLEPQARSDMVSYLVGSGLMPESVGVRRAAAHFLVKFPKSGLTHGWRRRVADELKIDSNSIIRLNNLVQQKGGYDGFKAELDKMTREMGVQIDPQVTVDVHRVFRMPGTLNSKSGLAKARCDDLDSFDPFTDACLLGSNEVNVRVKAPVKLKLKGKKFDIQKEFAALPAYAAVYLVCKGLADVN